jgi:DNA-binding transcriptional MerR regulator
LDPEPVSASTRFDDVDFPAYTMGRAAEMIGVTAAFLRSLGDAGLIAPQRSGGGHRRYSRHQLRLAARARELVDNGTALSAACRIVMLEDQLEAAHRRIEELAAGAHPPPNPVAEIPVQPNSAWLEI